MHVQQECHGDLDGKCSDRNTLFSHSRPQYDRPNKTKTSQDIVNLETKQYRDPAKQKI